MPGGQAGQQRIVENHASGETDKARTIHRSRSGPAAVRHQSQARAGRNADQGEYAKHCFARMCGISASSQHGCDYHQQAGGNRAGKAQPGRAQGGISPAAPERFKADREKSGDNNRGKGAVAGIIESPRPQSAFLAGVFGW